MTDSVNFKEFTLVRSRKRSGQTITMQAEPDDPLRTVAHPVVLMVADSVFHVGKMRSHVMFRQPRFGPLITDETFASLEDAVEWVIDTFDEDPIGT